MYVWTRDQSECRGIVEIDDDLDTSGNNGELLGAPSIRTYTLTPISFGRCTFRIINAPRNEIEKADFFKNYTGNMKIEFTVRVLEPSL